MKLIVIGLGAVVILIVVVVLAAMHYLKVDDADDFDELPDEQPRGGTADRDRYAGGRGSRLPGRPASDGPRRAAGGGQAAPPAYADQAGGRGPRQRDPRDYAADRDQAADRSGQRTTARYDDSRPAESRPQQRQDSLPAVRPRQARGKRADDAGDWPSTEWDELSDVDYWAEVASDKPLTTTAQPAAQARPARPDRDPEIRQPQGRRAAQAPRQDPAPLRNPAPGREAAARPDQPSRADRAPRPDRASRPDRAPGLPVRSRRQPAQAAPPAAGAGFLPAPPAAARSQPEAGQWLPSQPPHSQHSEPSLAMLAGLSSQQMPPAPDDDPLTSPSFPRVPASDSRSYHSGRGNTPASGSRVPAPYSAPTEQFAAYAAPSGQLGSYGAAGQQSPPARPRGYGQPGAPAPAPDRASPQPYRASPPPASPASAGYGGQAAGAGGYLAGQLPAAGRPRPAPAAAPRAAGNPYGSYVSPPARSGPAASSAGLPGGIPAGYDGYGPGQASGQRQAPYPPPVPRADIPAPSAEPGRGWYPGTASGPPPAYPDVSRQPAGPGQEATYLNGAPRAERAGYQAGHEPSPGYLPAGYPGPHDGAGSAGPDPYGRDPYGRYPGYGADR